MMAKKEFWSLHRATKKYQWGYPVGLEKRVIERWGGDLIVQPFCGKSNYGVGIDTNPEVRPTILGDGFNLPLRSNIADLVMIDMPYDIPGLYRALDEGVRISKQYIAFLHFMTPKIPKEAGLEALIAFATGPNHRIRAL